MREPTPTRSGPIGPEGQPMSDKRDLPWMIQGKPGQIHGLMVACMNEAHSVLKADGDDGTSAQDVIDVCRTVMGKHQIAMRVMASEPVFHDKGKGMYVSMHVTVHFCAPDGSYWPCSTPTGAMAPQLKSAPAALTAGIKSILRHAFMLHIVEHARDKRIVMSEALRAWHDALLTFKTLDELGANTDHPTRLALDADDLDAARGMYLDRREELKGQLTVEQMAYWEARDRARRDAERANVEIRTGGRRGQKGDES